MEPITITLCLLVFAIAMFVWEKIPLAVTSMVVCVALVLTGVLNLKHDDNLETMAVDPKADKLKRPEKFWINAALVVVLLGAISLLCVYCLAETSRKELDS